MFESSEVKSYLQVAGNSQESLFVDKFLTFIETYLRHKGFTLYTDSDTAEVEEWTSFSDSQKIHDLTFWVTLANLQKVEIKKHCSDEFEEIQTTGEGVAYTLKRRSNQPPRPYKELGLSCNVEALKVTAIWGFSDTLPPDLYFAILGILQQLLNIYRAELEKQKANGKDLRQLKIDEITYSFGSGQAQKSVHDKSQSTTISDFQNIFDHNQTFQSLLRYYV